MCLARQMNESTINKLRSDILGSDPRLRAAAIRTAIQHSSETTSLIPDLYSLCTSDFRPIASDSWAAIRRYKEWAVSFLVQLLDSADAKDRHNAIHLLLELGHNRSSYRLFIQILDDRPDSQPDWGSQRELVLKRLNIALSDSELNVRTSAAVALDDIGETPDSIVGLLVDGLNSTDIYIQNLSGLHLGRLGPLASAALPALRNFVKSNTDPPDETRRPVLAATNAIKRIGGT